MRSIKDNRVSQSRVPVEYTRNEKGIRICGSKRSRGGRCQSMMIMANGRCRMHGGASPTGPLSPSYRDGRYVKDMPAALQDRWQAAMSDTELLSLRKDTSLIDAMITSKLAELRAAEQNPDLERLTTLVEDMAANARTWDWTRMDRQIKQLAEAVTQQTTVAVAYREVRELIKEKADLVTRENRRMVELNQHMSVEEGLALIRMLIGSIRRACAGKADGPAILKTVTADYRSAISIREG